MNNEELFIIHYSLNKLKPMNKLGGVKKLPLIITTKVLVLLASATRLDLFEEVVALVIYQNEGWEVNYLNLPNGFHT